MATAASLARAGEADESEGRLVRKYCAADRRSHGKRIKIFALLSVAFGEVSSATPWVVLMAELKTKCTGAPVDDFLNSIADEQIRADSPTIDGIMTKATKAKPCMWDV